MKYKTKLWIKEKIPRKCMNFFSLPPKILEMLYFNWIDNKKLINCILVENEKKRSYELLLNSHILEKGMSHEEIRFGFGKNSLRALSAELKEWESKGYSKESSSYKIALSALHEYYLLHKKRKDDLMFLQKVLGQKLYEAVVSYNEDKKSGIKNYSGGEKFSSFTDFYKNRVSIREFDHSKEVSLEKIKSIIQVAKCAPSSCNRQTIKAYITLDPESVSKIISLHKGISVSPPGIIILTSDISAYPNAKTRNLPYVDSGLFANGLLLSATEKGIGTVVLNGCLSRSAEKQISQMLEIPKFEKITLLIAFGKMKGVSKVCESFRTPLDDTLTIIGK